jgi:hypothetical protein
MNNEISEHRISIHNSSLSTLTLAVEPWGEIWKIEPRHSVELVGKGPLANARFEVDFNPAEYQYLAGQGAPSLYSTMSSIRKADQRVFRHLEFDIRGKWNTGGSRFSKARCGMK